MCGEVRLVREDKALQKLMELYDCTSSFIWWKKSFGSHLSETLMKISRAGVCTM